MEDEPVKRQESLWENSVGIPLVISKWTLEEGDRPLAAMLFVPGYNHYQSPFYDWLANRLAPYKIASFGIDSESFGRSIGRGSARLGSCTCRGRVRAYVPEFHSLVQDVVLFAEHIRKQLPKDVPLFLHGESMGGGISSIAAKLRPDLFAGVCLVAPMAKLNTKSHPPAWVQALGAAVATILPWAPIAPLSDLAPLCFKDPVKLAEVLSGADKNRYYGRMRLATALQLRDAAGTVQAALPHITLPLLIQQGTADLVTPNAGDTVFESALACTDRTLVRYDQAWHALFAEPVDTRKRLVLDLVGWLAVRVPGMREAAKLVGEDLPSMPVGVHTQSRHEGSGPYRDGTVWSARHSAVPVAIKSHAFHVE